MWRTDTERLQWTAIGDFPDYRFEAKGGAHDDIGHLGLEQMLDILHNRFYWPNMEAKTTYHVCTYEWSLRFKNKQDEMKLCQLLVMYPLELVHMDFLTIENNCTSADMNILVIWDHFMWYAKAIVPSIQSTQTIAIAFWNKFFTNYGFPEKLLMDQGCTFESQLIKELCRLAHLIKVWTMPYHKEIDSQCERFNLMLINMISTLESDDKQHWKDILPTLVHAYNCTKNNAKDFSPYYLMHGHNPSLLIDIKFGLTSHKTKEHSHNKFVARLSAQFQKCYN